MTRVGLMVAVRDRLLEMLPPTRRGRILFVSVFAVGAAWAVSPVERTVAEVGRGGKSVEVADGIRLEQRLDFTQAFQGAVILFAEHRPAHGAVRVSLHDDLGGRVLQEPVVPAPRTVGDLTELVVPVRRPLEGDTTVLVIRTEGVAHADALRLSADPRGELGDETLHLFGARSEGHLRFEARRPLILSHRLVLVRPRWATVTPEVWKTAGIGLVLFAAGAGAVLSGRFFLSVSRGRPGKVTGMVLLLALGAVARWWFATQYLLVNDEQSYVYNGITWNIHQPYIWKSPVLIGLVALANQLWPFTDPLQPRMLIIAAGLLSVVLLAHVARLLVGPYAALGALLVGFLAPAPAAHSVLVLGEQLMAVPILLGIICVLRARRRTPASFFLLLVASGLLGLGVLTRLSAIFWFLPGVLLIWTRPAREFVRRAAALMSVPVLLGLAAIALFPEVARVVRILSELFQEFIEKSKGSMLLKIQRWRRIFGDFVPMLTLAGMAAAGRTSGGRLAGIIILGGIAAVFFFPHVSGRWESAYPWVPTVVGILPLAIWIGGRGFPGGLSGRRALEVVSFLVPPLLAYAIFHKTNEKYAAEFLPGLVLLAGVGLGRVLEALRTERQAGRAAVVATLIIVLTAAWYPVLNARSYAGTLKLRAVRESIAAVRSLTAPDDQVLAAAVLIPLFADRSVPGRLAHPSADQPRWRGRPNPGYHGRFGPIADMLERGEIAAVVTDKLFSDTYGRYPRIPPALEARYRLEREIDSGGGIPIRIYLRRSH